MWPQSQGAAGGRRIWHPIISGSSKGLRDGGEQGHLEPAVSRPGLITIPTGCLFQWWSLPSMLHSLTLLFLRLPEFYHAMPARHSSSPAALLHGGCDLRSVTFCSVADKAVIIWDNRGEKNRQDMSVIFPPLVSRGGKKFNCIVSTLCITASFAQVALSYIGQVSLQHFLITAAVKYLLHLTCQPKSVLLLVKAL